MGMAEVIGGEISREYISDTSYNRGMDRRNRKFQKDLSNGGGPSTNEELEKILAAQREEEERNRNLSSIEEGLREITTGKIVPQEIETNSTPTISPASSRNESQEEVEEVNLDYTISPSSTSTRSPGSKSNTNESKDEDGEFQGEELSFEQDRGGPNPGTSYAMSYSSTEEEEKKPKKRRG